MKLPRRNFLHLAAGAAALPVVSRIAWAQAYPSRPLRCIVAYAPGGGTDIFVRLVGQPLSERLGQPFVIENRAGAASNIATEAVVRAPADGYTLLGTDAAAAKSGPDMLTSSSSLYDPFRSLSPDKIPHCDTRPTRSRMAPRC
jgi:tripartite-type tricarboxylate transporter receptor subunit TctC